MPKKYSGLVMLVCSVELIIMAAAGAAETSQAPVLSRSTAILARAASARTPAVEPVDLTAIQRIREEGLDRSQIMDTASWLADVYGSRVTGTPSAREAGEWTARRLRDYGLRNVRLETWAPPSGLRGWNNELASARVIAPTPFRLIFNVNRDTPGTNGPVVAEAVHIEINTAADLNRYRGKLRGKFVFFGPLRPVPAHFTPEAKRWTDDELAALAAEPMPASPQPTEAKASSETVDWRQFIKDEGALAVFFNSKKGDGGTVFGGKGDQQKPFPAVTLATEHFGRIVRILDKGIPVTLELNIKNTFYDDPRNFFNVIGELGGTDKRNEVVMLGAHLDEVGYSSGATDNAAGCAVMMEAMRILKTIGLPLRRTVRIALWTGEEQRGLGSSAYIREHLAVQRDNGSLQLRPEYAKFSTYLNMDYGTGALRGVYLEGNVKAGSIFTAWMEPLRDLGITTVTPAGIGATDHVSFLQVGLPGFQFIQDGIEISTRAEHSNMDTFERLQPLDLQRAAVIVAAFASQAANRQDLLPRTAPH